MSYKRAAGALTALALSAFLPAMASAAGPPACGPNYGQGTNSSSTGSPGATGCQITSGNVDPDLTLTLPAAWTFPGPFADGTAATYTAPAQNVIVTTTGSATTLTAQDDGFYGGNGYMSNSTDAPTIYYLDNPLFIIGPSTPATGDALGSGGGSDTPGTAPGNAVTLDSWTAPQFQVSVPVSFSQQINSGEALRTGIYQIEIAYTLSDPNL